ncbi:hypothetical protein IE53DRAFT_57570 [Violaceomyces palustris]|uniref:Uncharacterized protein n=1 Tax=Violaceomyces palustris TaxID=1673888 RepID=A0ACD0NZY1_9BASI|nr:hypothetical protein IE53DRAFT_57570 [Violaceomyces palustris]
MPPRPKENVWSYPRPPALQKTSSRLRVIWITPSKQELVIADTTQGYRVLETSHPPTYYFPPTSVRTDLIRPSKARRTMCEWKGMAAYHDLQFSAEAGPLVIGRIWSYPSPTPAFTPIKDYLCFYASSKTDPEKLGRWKCMVDDDEVQAQEGDFYGSWITPEITGGDKGFKGASAAVETVQPNAFASSSKGRLDPAAAYKGMSFAETLEDLSSRFIVNLPADELASIERICFQVEQGHWFYEDFLRPLNPSLPSLGLRRFSSYLLHTSSLTVPLIRRYITGEGGQQDLEAAFDDFLKYKTRVPVCGAVLLAQDWDKCLLVKGWKSSSAWGFPKGKINQDEPERDCAIREVLEETGYDCSALLPPDSSDYLDLTMREQKIRLYIVPGVRDDTKFEALTRKEISKIAWFRLSDLPTWKKSKEPPPGMGGKFYLISPFIGRLKQWIQQNKYSHPNRPAKLAESDATRSGTPVRLDLGGDAATASPSLAHQAIRQAAFPSTPAKSSSTTPMPLFPDTSSLFPTFSEGQASAQKPPPLPAPPTSEKLKALLGLATSDTGSSDSYQALSSPSLPAHLTGVGPRMIEAKGDERGKELLELLRGAPPAASQHQPVVDGRDEVKAAALLRALNGSEDLRNRHGRNDSSSSDPQALLDLLNAHSRSQLHHSGNPTGTNMFKPPIPTQSPLPAPRPQKTIQAQTLLQMISPASSQFLSQGGKEETLLDSPTNRHQLAQQQQLALDHKQALHSAALAALLDGAGRQAHAQEHQHEVDPHPSQQPPSQPVEERSGLPPVDDRTSTLLQMMLGPSSRATADAASTSWSDATRQSGVTSHISNPSSPPGAAAAAVPFLHPDHESYAASSRVQEHQAPPALLNHHDIHHHQPPPRHDLAAAASSSAPEHPASNPPSSSSNMLNLLAALNGSGGISQQQQQRPAQETTGGNSKEEGLLLSILSGGGGRVHVPPPPPPGGMQGGGDQRRVGAGADFRFPPPPPPPEGLAWSNPPPQQHQAAALLQHLLGSSQPPRPEERNQYQPHPRLAFPPPPPPPWLLDPTMNHPPPSFQ